MNYKVFKVYVNFAKISTYEGFKVGYVMILCSLLTTFLRFLFNYLVQKHTVRINLF